MNETRHNDKHEVRTLHLVDLENLTGDPRAYRATALGVFERYLELARWRPGDLVYVATNPWLYKRIAWEPLVPWHLEFGHGEDGADRRLLAQAAPSGSRAGSTGWSSEAATGSSPRERGGSEVGGWTWW